MKTIEYEYTIEDTSVANGQKRTVLDWVDLDEAKKRLKIFRGQQQIYIDYGGKAHHLYSLIRRVKPEPYEVLTDVGGPIV